MTIVGCSEWGTMGLKGSNVGQQWLGTVARWLGACCADIAAQALFGVGVGELIGCSSPQAGTRNRPNQLAAKVRVRFKVMVWLEGGQGEVRGACD